MNELKQGFCIKRDWRFDTLTVSFGVSAEVTCLGQKTSYVQDLRKSGHRKVHGWTHDRLEACIVLF